MARYHVGQLWLSDAEPELGLGKIGLVDDQMVFVVFPSADVERAYSAARAPLTRVRFRVGDHVRSIEGWSLRVESVNADGPLMVYRGKPEGGNGPTGEIELLETALDTGMSFSSPMERLFAHQIDDDFWFDLRYETLRHRSRLDRMPVKGLIGPRAALIPHQFYIGHEVSRRFAPRVLLADEVGLGKTIEAGLITHRLVLTGRISRVLILVPEALVFQWFVELFRRFNLEFVMLDEARCLEIEQDNEGDDEHNPFEAQQFALAPLDWLVDTPARLEQAAGAEWDLLIVDEAHHLSWSESEISDEYRVVEQLAFVTPSVLLLTATPEQLGKPSHFARLRLLDPHRFYDLDTFIREEEQYAPVAREVNRLLESGDDGDAADLTHLRSLLQLGDDRSHTREEVIEQLLDRHGTGRVLFRNARSSVTGFSGRALHTYVVAKSGDDADPRFEWLGDLLQQLGSDKVLVICHDSAVAESLERHLGGRRGIRTALFVETMDLIARDRAAAYFAEPYRGAQVLVCSEIGSEGRNFQFAHQLVLFDLPEDPDVLEQRIGRLDRIGQQRDIAIHVPYVQGSREHLLCRWFDEGMDLFQQPNPAADAIYRESRDELTEWLTATSDGGLPDGFDTFILDTKARNDALAKVLAEGRDRLLELHSHQPHVSSALIDDIGAVDRDPALAGYMERAFDAFGLEMDALDNYIQVVTPGETVERHDVVSWETQKHARFPQLPEEGVSITYDRATALAREDVAFISWEHPWVQQAMELVLASHNGTTGLVIVRHPALPRGSLYLEALHVADCSSPASLAIERFLPATVIRTLTDTAGRDHAEALPDVAAIEVDAPTDRSALLKVLDQHQDSIKAMLTTGAEHAAGKLDGLVAAAETAMARDLSAERERLEALARVNANVREEELQYHDANARQLAAALATAQLRQDAIRIVIAT